MARLQKHERDALALVKRLTAPWNLEVEVQGHGGKTHLMIVIRGHGASWRIEVASSPKNRDHCLRAVQTRLKRILAELPR